VLGLDHPSTMVSMNSFAVMLRRQGKHSTAEEIHLQMPKLCEKVLSLEHSSRLINMSNLGVVLNS
jgi:hypothetical protein